jgi:formyl-CoA transferase
MHSFESLTEDEHLREVGFFRKVDHPVEGEMIDMANPNKFSAGLREDYAAASLLGGDSIAILSEIGFEESEIDEMVGSKAVIDGRAARDQQ